eukprot:66293-Prorocentrum_minimum.AAC.1
MTDQSLGRTRKTKSYYHSHDGPIVRVVCTWPAAGWARATSPPRPRRRRRRGDRTSRSGGYTQSTSRCTTPRRPPRSTPRASRSARLASRDPSGGPSGGPSAVSYTHLTLPTILLV